MANEPNDAARARIDELEARVERLEYLIVELTRGVEEE